jgi:hypothetical protein
MLDGMFAPDRGLDIFAKLEINETLDGIPFGKARDQSISMFINSSNKVARHPYLQDIIRRARQHLNPSAGDPRVTKDVVGRDKPGHDGFG